MSHKSGHIIVKMVATEETDAIKDVSVEVDVSHKTPEEVAAILRKVMKKIEQMSTDED